MSDATGTTLPASQDYRQARERLREAELRLRDHIEQVAELRRGLPPGPVVDPGYRLREGDPDLEVDGPDTHRQTTLAELFDPGTRQLFVYHLRFAPQWDQGCPHVQPLARRPQRRRPPAQGDDQLPVIAKAELPKLRGWSRLRLLSSFGTSFNADLGAEHPEWGEKSRISVFTKDQDGTIQLFYWGDPYFGQGPVPRHRPAQPGLARPRATDRRPAQGW